MTIYQYANGGGVLTDKLEFTRVVVACRAQPEQRM
jgi:hypothetical protein